MVSITRTEMMMLGVAAIALALAVGLVADLQQVSFAQESAVDVTEEDVVEVDATDLLLENINATIAAVSTLVAGVIGIITYVISAIRSKTGDKIISKDAEDKILDVFAQVRQKDNELRDVYRQVLEQKETLKVALDMVKSTNPEVRAKIDEAIPIVNKTIEKDVRPQIAEWQTQADRFYETLLKKPAIGSSKS